MTCRNRWHATSSGNWKIEQSGWPTACKGKWPGAEVTGSAWGNPRGHPQPRSGAAIHPQARQPSAMFRCVFRTVSLAALKKSRLGRAEPGSWETRLEITVVSGQWVPGMDWGKWREASRQGTRRKKETPPAAVAGMLVWDGGQEAELRVRPTGHLGDSVS